MHDHGLVDVTEASRPTGRVRMVLTRIGIFTEREREKQDDLRN